jgi:hypothetical protein
MPSALGNTMIASVLMSARNEETNPHHARILGTYRDLKSK